MNDENSNGVLRYRIDQLEKAVQELRATQSKIVWIVIGTAFSITGSLIVIAVWAVSSNV